MMDSDLYSNNPPAGLDLEDYFPTKCTYDSVIYVHKKYLPHYKGIPQRTLDKCQQFDGENFKTGTYKVRKTVKNNANKDPVVEQTIRFAESIIPLTIPPSTDASPYPEYTIKATKRSKRKPTDTNTKQNSESVKNDTYEKEKPRSIFEHFKREKLKRQRDSISARETVSSSQNNTLDDINENQTLSCTLSEISERKHHKEDRHCKRNKRNETQKVAVSESFEAVATEFMNTSNDTKIKIHLMNEKDKNLFCEKIQAPIIGALKEFMMEWNNENFKALQRMQTSIELQNKKIDTILNKLTCFEEKLDFYAKDRESTTITVASKTTKASKLEELSKDLELKSSSEEEMGQMDLLNKSVKDGSVEAINSKDKNVERRSMTRIENLGCGENAPVPSKSQMGIKPERPNRVPARFCWTEAARTS